MIVSARSVPATLIGLLLCAAPPAARADPLPAGSYQATCTGAAAAYGSLTASCSNGRGAWSTTTLDYRSCTSDIWNAYGRLVCVNGVPAGSYLASCSVRSFDGYWLIASCRTISGRWVETRLDVPSCPAGDLTNINGTLRCGAHSCQYLQGQTLECTSVWPASDADIYFLSYTSGWYCLAPNLFPPYGMPYCGGGSGACCIPANGDGLKTP